MRSVPEVSSSRWGSADTGSNCPRRWGGSWPNSSPRGGARRGSPNWGQVGFEGGGKPTPAAPFPPRRGSRLPGRLIRRVLRGFGPHVSTVCNEELAGDGPCLQRLAVKGYNAIAYLWNWAAETGVRAEG